jgi:putative membrane protein
VAQKPVAADRSGALRAAVLLLPVVFLMVLPAGSLGSRAFQARFTGTSMATGADSAGSPSAGANLDNERRFLESASDGADPQALGEQTLLELLLDPGRYDGRPVFVTGMLMRDTRLEAHFGGRNTAVYRFLITCCAADALPLAVAVDPEQVAGLEVDAWISVKGTFRLRQTDGKQVPLIEDAWVEVIEAPSQPYLF